MGWFFGLQPHLVFSHDNEIIALKLTPRMSLTPRRSQR